MSADVPKHTRMLRILSRNWKELWGLHGVPCAARDAATVAALDGATLFDALLGILNDDAVDGAAAGAMVGGMELAEGQQMQPSPATTAGPPARLAARASPSAPQQPVQPRACPARAPAAQLAPQAVVQPRGRVKGWLSRAIARGDVPRPTLQLLHTPSAIRE